MKVDLFNVIYRVPKFYETHKNLTTRLSDTHCDRFHEAYTNDANN